MSPCTQRPLARKAPPQPKFYDIQLVEKLQCDPSIAGDETKYKWAFNVVDNKTVIHTILFEAANKRDSTKYDRYTGKDLLSICQGIDRQEILLKKVSEIQSEISQFPEDSPYYQVFEPTCVILHPSSERVIYNGHSDEGKRPEHKRPEKPQGADPQSKAKTRTSRGNDPSPHPNSDSAGPSNPNVRVINIDGSKGKSSTYNNHTVPASLRDQTMRDLRMTPIVPAESSSTSSKDNSRTKSGKHGDASKPRRQHRKEGSEDEEHSSSDEKKERRRRKDKA